MRRFAQKRISFPHNDQIRGNEFRVIDAQGENLGVLSREEALKRARDQGLDLVLIASKAQPPVVRITDYEKFAYGQQKNQAQLIMKQRQGGDMKQFRFRPNIDDNDLAIRIKRIREFLKKKSKIKIVIPFMGRIITHTQLGYDKINTIMSQIDDVGEIEQSPRMEGKMLITYLKPK